MGFFDLFKNTKEQDRPQFRISDGSGISSKEYGYLSVGVSVNSASETFENLFLNDKLTKEMYFSELANSDRFLVELAITSMFVGVYLHHLLWNLRVLDENIINKVKIGIDDGFKNIKTNEGKTITPELQKILIAHAFNYVSLIKEDLKVVGTYSVSPSSTKLLNTLVTIFTDRLSRDQANRLSRELIESPSATLLKAYIVSDILAVATVIERTHRIELII